MKRWLRLTLQLLSLGLFGFILWLGGPDTWRQILSGDRRNILISFLLIGLAGMLSATRLQLMARSVAGRGLASWRRFYYLSMTTRALGLVVPRSVSILAGKPVALRTLGLPLKRSVWAVLMDNAFDLSLLSVMVVSALLFLRGKISPGGFVALTLALILALAGLLFCWTAAAGRLLPFIERLGRMPGLVSVLQLDSESAITMLPTRLTAMWALGLSVLLNGALATCFYYIACAVGLTYSWSLFAACFPVTQLSLVLAVTPGGLGLFDASWYGVLLLGGVSHQEALTFIIAQRAYVYVFVLIWAGFSALISPAAERQNRA